MEDPCGCRMRNLMKDEPSYVRIFSTQSQPSSEHRYLDNPFFKLLQEQKSLANETIKVKHKIKTEVTELIALLKKRELELCEKMDDIYQNWISHIINEMANPNSTRMDSIWCRNKTDYVSSFDELKKLVMEYGTLGTFENKNGSSFDLNDRHVTNKSASNLNFNPEISNFDKHNSEGKECDLKEECMPMNSEFHEFTAVHDCGENETEESSTESSDSFEVLDSSYDTIHKKCLDDGIVEKCIDTMTLDRCKQMEDPSFVFERICWSENCFNQCRQSSEVSSWLSNTTEAKKLKMNHIFPPIVPNNKTYLQHEPSSQLKNQLNNPFLNTSTDQEASHSQRVKYICMNLKNGFDTKSFHNDTSSISEWLHKKEPRHVSCIAQQFKQASTCTAPSDLIKQSFSSFLVKENKNDWLHCNPQTH